MKREKERESEKNIYCIQITFQTVGGHNISNFCNSFFHFIYFPTLSLSLSLSLSLLKPLISFCVYLFLQSSCLVISLYLHFIFSFLSYQNFFLFLHNSRSVLFCYQNILVLQYFVVAIDV